MRSRDRLRRLQVGKELVAFLFGEGRDFAEARGFTTSKLRNITYTRDATRLAHHNMSDRVDPALLEVLNVNRVGFDHAIPRNGGAVIDAQRQITDLPIVSHLPHPPIISRADKPHGDDNAEREARHDTASHEGYQVGEDAERAHLEKTRDELGEQQANADEKANAAHQAKTHEHAELERLTTARVGMHHNGPVRADGVAPAHAAFPEVAGVGLPTVRS